MTTRLANLNARRRLAGRQYQQFQALASPTRELPRDPDRAPAKGESIPAESVAGNRIVLNRAGSIALSLISLRKRLEGLSPDGLLSAHDADNLLNVCQVLGFAEPMVRFVLGERNV